MVVDASDTDRVSVLICESSQVQLRILSEAVREAGYIVQTASNAKEALAILDLVPVDIFVTGIEVGEMSGLEACWSLKASAGTESIYTIVITASGDDRRLEESLDAGADDFIRKPVNMTELRARLRAASRLVRMQQQFRRLAETDALTGAANRRAFMQYLDMQVQQVRRQDARLGVVMVDLDHFKRINDTHGHAAGDRVLVDTVRAIQACLGERDMLGRLGGEEFAVLLPGVDAAELTAAAERLREAVAALSIHAEDGQPIPVTASLGCALAVPGGALDMADDLLQSADEALYEAKNGGRNRVVLARQPGEAPVKLRVVG